MSHTDDHARRPVRRARTAPAPPALDKGARRARVVAPAAAALDRAARVIERAGPELRPMLAATVEQAQRLLELDGAVVHLLQEPRSTACQARLAAWAASGLLASMAGEHRPLDGCLQGRALTSGEPLSGEDADRPGIDLHEKLGAHSVLVLPIELDGRAQGTFTVVSSHEGLFATAAARARCTSVLLRLCKPTSGRLERAALLGELAATQTELAQRKVRSQVTMEMLVEGVLVVDRRGTFEYCNNAAAHILSMSTAEITGRHTHDARWQFIQEDGSPWPAAEHPAAVTLETGRVCRDVVMGVAKADCEVTWISVTSRPLADARGKRTGAVVVFSDVTEQRTIRRQLEYQARHDQLTGLANRRLLHDELEAAIARAQRLGLAVALVYVDLDGFKRINDTLGHSAGDAVLRTVARRLSSTVRDGELMSRYGGDEFVALLSMLAEPHRAVESFSARMTKALSEPVQVMAGMVRVGASFGASIYPHDGRTSEALLNHADAAMFASKHRDAA